MLPVVLVALTASADIPPPRGYVETCTIARQCGEGEEGAQCSAYFDGREACEALEAAGWTRKCRTAGASTWTEVFCRATGEGDKAAVDPEPSDVPPPPPEPPSTGPEEGSEGGEGAKASAGSRCSVLGTAGMAWLWVPVAAAARRRR